MRGCSTTSGNTQVSREEGPWRGLWLCSLGMSKCWQWPSISIGLEPSLQGPVGVLLCLNMRVSGSCGGTIASLGKCAMLCLFFFSIQIFPLSPGYLVLWVFSSMFGNHLFLIGRLALTSDIKQRWPWDPRGKGVILGPKRKRRWP